MKRMEILKRLEKAGVIAVVRGKDHTEAVQASEAILAGGIKGIEVTFTVPNAQAVIQELAETYRDREEEAVIGAGTVLDAMTARLAIMAGAEFIVSPSFDQETAEICNLYQIPYLPGCMTITEIQQALKSGADIIKLFPEFSSGHAVRAWFQQSKRRCPM
jgi:2-dehydro-3-deoxyphosphogluconate aldolase / (4S)-4-hydroxy-2-oxoglutarate aldolase